MLEILTAGAATIAILTGGFKSAHWMIARRRNRKALKQQAAAAPAPPAYPVRLTCRNETEFHPSAGYREGFNFEVFNHSDRRVQVRHFGLEIKLHHQDDWYDYITPRRPPPQYEFPVWLEPNEALDGFVDTESIADDYYEEGTHEYFVNWKPYVDVAGFGKHYVEIDRA